MGTISRLYLLIIKTKYDPEELRLLLHDISGYFCPEVHADRRSLSGRAAIGCSGNVAARLEAFMCSARLRGLKRHIYRLELISCQTQAVNLRDASWTANGSAL